MSTDQLQNFPLYESRFEHDACGIGFIANLDAQKSHAIIEQGIQVLINLTHRGASGCDPKTGDGAGILIQVPHRFFVRECGKLGFTLPAEGEYGVGMVFLPVEPAPRFQCEGILERIVREEGLTVLGWRDIPVDANSIGRVARVSQPYIEQIFIRRAPGMSSDDLERRLYVIRKRAENEITASDIKDKNFFTIPSMSSRTIVYKGLLLAPQIARFYGELSDPDTMSALCLVHQRFSTNTLPNWKLAHPFRMLCHNGEINTIRGNANWMYARQSVLKSDLFGSDIEKLFPIIQPEVSDSATLDNVVELLTLAGRSLPHVMAMVIPEAWDADASMAPEKKAFYEYHASLMEPWDGPAAVAFTDGKIIGAILDRNGLRPARYIVTYDRQLIMASEAGVLPVHPENVKMKGCLKPGRMLLADLEEKRIIPDEEIKQLLAGQKSYAQWIRDNQITLDQLPESPRAHGFRPDDILRRQRLFGYTDEDIRMIITPMAVNGEEPIGSMGTDTPLACLSDKPQPLFNYFRQMFAQVTNPSIDPLREESVMSLTGYIGPERNILEETPQHCHTLKLSHPILTNKDLEKMRRVSWGDFLATTLPMVFRVAGGAIELERALDGLCRRASLAIEDGYSILILSDRGYDEEYAPVPSLLALTAVHNHLVREKKRTQMALVVESGEPREVMHFSLLIGYGASAVNPYLAIETLEELVNRKQLPEGITFSKALDNYEKAVKKGLLKVISKMGISTLHSYRGAQAFEAIGLGKRLVEKFFTGTPSRIGGVGLNILSEEVRRKHVKAFSPVSLSEPELDLGGNYSYRTDGEKHLINPETITTLQKAVRFSDRTSFKQYLKIVDEQNLSPTTLRGLIEFNMPSAGIPLSEVEPTAQIVRRFCTGAMSFGSISKEAHETLALAMNRIGGRSNTGEGGEDESRYIISQNGDSKRSAIKQIASGRFGVTVQYLVNADELQIKIAQGAKPGEGGQLPGHKVDAVIARTRHSIPGVSLISPPPHHDIYSIEDLAQLIYDLKNVNPSARISVKLVAEAGVGTIAAGVAKAGANVILISGDSGGTGASPLTSMKHAGVPWELGLAETQQVLVMNDLRSRVRLQTDGKLQTARDVVIAALLGAEEFGFATTPLIAMGCVMLRKCHLNTCAVGIATQDPVLRAKFSGTPEHVMNYFIFLAEEVRELMAQLGFRSVDEMIGRVDLLKPRQTISHWKAKSIDISALLHNPVVPARFGRRSMVSVKQHPVDTLDPLIIDQSRESIELATPVALDFSIRNVHRSVGSRLSGEIARRYGSEGLPDDTIRIRFKGSAGQSFGAFLAHGVTLELEGDANDYVGKGLSGGKLILYPPRSSSFLPHESVIIGNVALYGATSGEVYICGEAGERFAVRNSGATAVVESIGDHGCEYMTNGVVVVLGRTGRNFAAGMSGGIGCILDESGDFAHRLCNRSSVDLDELDEADVSTVKTMIQSHLEHTRSPRAQSILNDWDQLKKKFVKVFPHDYKRVLREQQKRSVPDNGSLLEMEEALVG